MINNQMKNYNYQTYGELNDYGQPQLSKVKGTIKMAINFSSETIAENSLYSEAQFIGLTLNKNIDAILCDRKKLYPIECLDDKS